MPHDPTLLPTNLPVPADDGAAAHLTGAALPTITLPCTDGTSRDLRAICSKPTVLFFYPRTGVPGQPPSKGFSGEDWDEIPGARGCTPQSCGFRDLHAEFTHLGVRVLGISTNTLAHQREFKARLHVPYEFLSDADLALTRALRLPTFEFPIESGMTTTTLMKRMSWFCRANGAGGRAPRIERVWYPVFPPNENAACVLEWLRGGGTGLAVA